MMSHRTEKTFGSVDEKSSIDRDKVVVWLSKLTGHKHVVHSTLTHDIIDMEAPITIEHKADQQEHKTGNICIEAYKRKTGHKQWLYTCDADFLIVTSHTHLRIYRWKGILQNHLIENYEYFSKFLKPGGDDNGMMNLCIPLKKVETFVEWERPWDNNTSLQELQWKNRTRITTSE